MKNQESHFMKVSANANLNAAARRVSTPFIVDGVPMTFLAYNIDGSTYVGIRDLALTLSGTSKQFNVTWNGAQNAIHITTCQPYIAVGGEMPSGGADEACAIRVNSKIFLDGKAVKVNICRIEGRNFFRLRDLCIALDFFVHWEITTPAIAISTIKQYQGPIDTGGKGIAPGARNPIMGSLYGK